MKKLSLLALATIAIFSFTGCFNFGIPDAGTPATSSVDENSFLYETGEFSIVVPKEWQVIEPKDFTGNIPEETVVAFRNNVKNENWTATAVVVKKSLEEQVNSEAFAQMVVNRQNLGLAQYDEITKDSATISIGGQDEPTLFTVFETQLSQNEPVARYLQISGVKGSSGFIAMGSFLPEENQAVAQTVEKIVRSLRIK